MAKFKCIYLEWEDAVAAADWEEVTEAALFKCKTLGSSFTAFLKFSH